MKQLCHEVLRCGTTNSAVSGDPRETMRRLPEFLQLPLTLITGKPYRGQRRPAFSPTLHVASSFLSLAGGCIVGAAGMTCGGAGWVLLPVGWVLTLHGMRNLRMMIFHQAAHGNLYRRPRVDRFIAEFISSLLVIQNFERYSVEHRIDHHGTPHMTLKDPTVQAILIGLGLRCEMPVDKMWRVVLRKTLSPIFHLRFALGRLRSFFKRSSPRERLFFLGFHGTGLLTGVMLGWWPQLLLLWLVPLVPLFQGSNVFRLCVKHTFPPAGSLPRKGRQYMASLTNAIFIGEAAPSQVTGLRGAAAWAKWAVRMTTIHVPVRLLILTGDTVVHDYHHRHPTARNWANYIFARQEDEESEHTGWPPYREVWGLRAGMDAVFHSLANADPREFNPVHIASVSDRELFEAFED